MGGGEQGGKEKGWWREGETVEGRRESKRGIRRETLGRSFTIVCVDITKHPFSPRVLILINTHFQGRQNRFQTLAGAWQDSESLEDEKYCYCPF